MLLSLFSLLVMCFSSTLVSEEIIIIEAEDYTSTDKEEIRAWKVIDATVAKGNKDLLARVNTASEGSYVEILPDTRVTHDDLLEQGISFSNEPGLLGIINYEVDIPSSGRYYVWVKAYSSGTEDNGIHVGIDGTWPESGQRMQWCEGKNQWYWESKQRTEDVHCGEPKLIYLDIEKSGLHTISFSMREDGFEFDQWSLTRVYARPE